MPLSDHVWRERGLRDAVLAGDARAWQTLYDESFARLFAYVQWRCAGVRDLAEEVTQETWLVAVRRIGSFEPEQGTFLSWLRGIAGNLVRNQLRRRVAAFRGDQTTAAPASAELERRDEAERIARALAELPEDYEDVLRAKYLDGLPVDEIAERRGQSGKAIESLLSRARAAFRSLCPEMAPGEES